MDWRGKWIWTAERVPARNARVRFRRDFDWAGGRTQLFITADSRYVLYVNGEYLGQGPVRSWPAHWKYDMYDLTPYVRRGRNQLAVLVQHLGEGTFQYLPAPPGLLAQVEVEGDLVTATDTSWLAAPAVTPAAVAPRISVQEGFEEQFDARLYDNWLTGDVSGWQQAVAVRNPGDPPHTSLEPRDIPFLTLEPCHPSRVVRVEAVTSLPYRWHLHIKPYLHRSDVSSNRAVHHAYLFTQVWSSAAAEVQLHRPHLHRGPVKLNGRLVEGERLPLVAGWNTLLVDYRGLTHLQAAVFAFDGPPGLRFACRGEAGGSAWAVIGPFALTPALQQALENGVDDSTVVCEPWHLDATAAAGLEVWENANSIDITALPMFQEMQPEHLPPDVFLECYTDRPVEATPRVENLEALLSANHEWAVVHPCAEGDVRILLDFGREVVGFHRFEVEGPAGTVLDWHNFEFIQPDGRHNLAEGMNNTFRYIMCDGRQTYQTLERRGLQYSYLTLRNMSGPVRIRRVEVLFNTYPQARRGNFACSDAQLDRIWQIGAHSLRCCAEDTYVDCPTYEQTHWVGDARNEALVDWVINGDPRLWFRCLLQAGQSLERSALVESHVPSAWQNILPAWSFLWMRSCREYWLYTGDRQGSCALLDLVAQNVEGVARHINPQGLFSIRAWNMFDWAAMDTPARGVVTHINCFAVLALNECAALAAELGRPSLAVDWRQLAASITAAVNDHLWSEEKRAYTDCLRDGAHSPVFSQQTQTVAFMAGVAQGERAAACRRHMENPPRDFVRAGSPFFEFFLLEALAQEGRDAEFLDVIRRDWGFMADKGATTFWEMWSRQDGRLTRSHCHGWSAAPTFFLTTHVLGVKPLSPGFGDVLVAPHPGGLSWCRGTMPTPHGDIAVQWEDKADQPFTLRITAPAGVSVTVQPPRSATVWVNGEKRP